MEEWDDEVALFMRPRRAAFSRIAHATHPVPDLPCEPSCASAHIHALGVCASKLALANWLDALPYPIMEKAVHDLQTTLHLYKMNESARASLESETFHCHACSRTFHAAYMASHIADHTCKIDAASIALPYSTGYEPLVRCRESAARPGCV
jgi:hypothetical protein